MLFEDKHDSSRTIRSYHPGSFALLAWSYDDNCSMWLGYLGVSLDIENYCTLRLFFDLSTLAGLSRRNLPEAGIRL
ncbi:hypothetical protein, partial [Escherichia coli]|uniref:hypothetical protein n=3 Tax=Escherichia TaxID=561 RepID=UPI00226D9B48